MHIVIAGKLTLGRCSFISVKTKTRSLFLPVASESQQKRTWRAINAGTSKHQKQRSDRQRQDSNLRGRSQ
ncbi:Serine/threonine-protein kinase nrc-2 [Fusarium oxysporum f. sp. albedinis]|nr:Serine/threonine-protein kinase nrc-2 [Fusarium oxysporum f. sp. albedinis]